MSYKRSLADKVPVALHGLLSKVRKPLAGGQLGASSKRSNAEWPPEPKCESRALPLGSPNDVLNSAFVASWHVHITPRIKCLACPLLLSRLQPSCYADVSALGSLLTYRVALATAPI